MAIDTGGERRALIGRVGAAQTQTELETAIAAVERLLEAEPGDPELESLLRGLDARFTRLTHDPIINHELGAFYHPERDPSLGR